MNRLLGQKISITSRRPQTTRHRILGIKTEADYQIVYVDTPGIHSETPRAMNRYLNKAALETLHDVDVIVLLVEDVRWLPDDQWVLEKLQTIKSPVILALNKIDRLDNRESLLPQIKALSEKMHFSDVIPLSARRGENVEVLEKSLTRLLPESVPFFPEDQITDRSERFLAAEMVREKLFRKLGKEIPYGLTVEIEHFKHEGKTLHIHALILIEKSSQKPIVIGNKGKLLKEVGSEARKDMQQMFDVKVFLNLWVKVKEGWADDERALQSLGYHNDL